MSIFLHIYCIATLVVVASARFSMCITKSTLVNSWRVFRQTVLLVGVHVGVEYHNSSLGRNRAKTNCRSNQKVATSDEDTVGEGKCRCQRNEGINESTSEPSRALVLRHHHSSHFVFFMGTEIFECLHFGNVPCIRSEEKRNNSIQNQVGRLSIEENKTVSKVNLNQKAVRSIEQSSD